MQQSPSHVVLVRTRAAPMSAQQQRSALITGVSTGIGRDLAVALAKSGYGAITLLDVDVPGMTETANEVRRLNSAVQCTVCAVDVSQYEAQDSAIRAHVQRHGNLDLVVLNAGIAERGNVFDPGNQGWQKTLDIDLTAVLHGVRSAVSVMGPGGTVITIASAGGVFPMPTAPVYSASKAGVVQFVRSVGGSVQRQRGVRVMAVCPEFVDTPLVRTVMRDDPAAAKRLLGSLDIKLLPPSAVTDLILRLTDDTQHRGGTVALLRQDGKVEFPFARTAQATKVDARSQPASSAGQDTPALAGWAQKPLSHGRCMQRKWQVHTLSHDFARATRLVSCPVSHSVPAGQLLVRRVYVGINASDVNYTAGRYLGSPAKAQALLPFDCGFESVNVVAAVGEGVKGIQPGSAVASFSYDAFSEWGLLPANQALPVPDVRPEVVALLTSGLTASIALETCAALRPGQTVLVTAAAGGTGQFAVQLAKRAGCYVIATAGGPSKAALCRDLGADRVVDYRSEKLKDVLKREYPKGVDVVYESVGGDMFKDAVACLADNGRVIIIGMMAQYAEGWPRSNYPGLAETLLWKNASLHGFFLLRHTKLWRPHLARLVRMWRQGHLRVSIDPTRFVGIESIPAAVALLQGGSSMGKVVVQVAGEMPPHAVVSRL